ncbi:MAG: hypothetical protein O9272_05710, partial [Brevundimonas sp.]|nr:hypothetical protein [Brevundimonas sp.]
MGMPVLPDVSKIKTESTDSQLTKLQASGHCKREMSRVFTDLVSLPNELGKVALVKTVGWSSSCQAAFRRSKVAGLELASGTPM